MPLDPFKSSIDSRKTSGTHLPKGIAYDYAVRSRVILMSEGGMSSNEISTKTGIDASVIRRWIRRYQQYGPISLRPYWRSDNKPDSRASVRADKDSLFQEAYEAYVTSRDSVAAITRRFGLDYHAFKYHLERYHPEYVESRRKLETSADSI